MLKALKALVPPPVAGALGNCGGTNWRPARFAANLLRPDLPDDEYLAICHSLIFRNGVRKTTAPARNSAVFRELLATGRLPRKPSLRVLEVGASVGLDALATFAILRERYAVERYDLGDLYTEIRYEPRRGLVFDQDGDLVQVDLGPCFVAMHFAYNYPFQRITNLPKRALPWLLARRLRPDPGAPVTRIPLFHPRLAADSPESPFRSKRIDVFGPIDGPYDLIVCMHLLVERYFDRETIARAIDNLSRALSPGGALVVGATERFEVIARRDDGSFDAPAAASSLSP